MWSYGFHFFGTTWQCECYDVYIVDSPGDLSTGHTWVCTQELCFPKCILLEHRHAGQCSRGERTHDGDQ